MIGKILWALLAASAFYVVTENILSSRMLEKLMAFFGAFCVAMLFRLVYRDKVKDAVREVFNSDQSTPIKQIMANSTKLADIAEKWKAHYEIAKMSKYRTLQALVKIARNDPEMQDEEKRLKFVQEFLAQHQIYPPYDETKEESFDALH